MTDAPGPVLRLAYPTPANPNVSKSMRGNRRANTRPELRVRKLLREAGFPGYRLQWRVAGRPDVAYPGRRIAVLVHGCFWHGCERCAIRRPSHNAEYWSAKISRNCARDARVRAELEAAGWKVFVIRECSLRNDPDVLQPLLSHVRATYAAATPVVS